jgi:hypothetical protein
MTLFSNPITMKVDSVHLLDDLAKMYDSGTEMLVSEALGNAVDVGATKLQIEFGEDHDGQYVSFFNNGPPMKLQDFKNYHVIARSSKTIGKSLGWAGIGAKLYLGVWNKSKIVTESSDGKDSLASQMFIDDCQVYWNFITSERKFFGTSYRVYLNPEDYQSLSNNIGEIIVKYFNTAMKNGLDVIIQGKKLEPWVPEIIKSIEEQVSIKHKKFLLILYLTKEKINDERCNIEYHVSGKNIIIKKPRNLLSNVKPEFKKKFFVIVDALDVSDQLSTNKHSFRGGIFPKEIEPKIELKILHILKQLGCLEDPQDERTLKNKFTKDLQKILKEEFPELNPKSIYGNMNKNGRSPGIGKKTKGIEAKKSSGKEKIEHKEKHAPKRKRNRGGFSVTTVNNPEDARQGWIQIETNQIVVNLGHPVAKRMEKPREAKEYHQCRIIFNELLKLEAKSGKLSVEKAFEKSDKFFVRMMGHQTKHNEQIAWNFNGEQDAMRDEYGKFLSK